MMRISTAIRNKCNREAAQAKQKAWAEILDDLEKKINRKINS